MRTSIRSQWIRVWMESSASACVEAQNMDSASLSVRWRTTVQQVKLINLNMEIR